MTGSRAASPLLRGPGPSAAVTTRKWDRERAVLVKKHGADPGN